MNLIKIDKSFMMHKLISKFVEPWFQPYNIVPLSTYPKIPPMVFCTVIKLWNITITYKHLRIGATSDNT